MGDAPRGIYPKTLILNKLMTEDAYRSYVHDQVVRVNSHQRVEPLFKFAMNQGIVDEEIHAQINEKLITKIKKTPYFELMAKIKKRNDDVFCKVLSKHKLLEESDIEALQNLCPATSTGMDLTLIALHSGYLPASIISVAEHKVHEVLDAAMQKKVQKNEEEKGIEDGASHKLDDLIHKTLKSHMHIRLLEYIKENNVDVVDYNEIPKLIGVELDVSKRMFRDWIKVGILRKLVGSVYNYGPDSKMREKINLFFEYWENPATKRILTRMIESCKNEQRSKTHVGLGRYF